MAMTDISFQDVPKKFRYYAKSLMKIATPSIEKTKRETITSGDEDSRSSKSDDKCDVSRTSKGNSPGEKNVLPTPPGSPEETLNWNSASEYGNGNGGAGAGGGVGIGGSGAPIDLIKNGDFPPETVAESVPHNYLRNVTSGVPFLTEDLESEDHRPHHHHAHRNFQPDVNLPFSTATDPIIARALASGVPKRLRTEKKPIPCEQKDDKYFERRKRNNQAAKKSRDARKHREDQIAVRANLLEKENAILRAQVSTLRDEANSLRQLLIQKRQNRTQ